MRAFPGPRAKGSSFGVRLLPVLVGICLLGSGCERSGEGFRAGPERLVAHLEETKVRVVFYNWSAHATLRLHPPNWMAEKELSPKAERVRAMDQAALDPKLFRQLDRQERFEALVLAGDPVRYRPLQEHLTRTGDWALDWVDPWGVVYRRSERENITPDSIRAVAAGWEQEKPGVRARAYAAMAERLVAASRMEIARELIDLALKADPTSAAAWTVEGGYRLARGEWSQGIAAAERALARARMFPAALSVKAQGLYFSKRFEEAHTISCMLLEKAPEDPVMLFNHAKIAHEVRAIQEEVGVLRKLVGIAEREHRSASWYRVYLGQALAMTGEGESALQEFNLALEDAALAEETRDFARSARDRVALRVRARQPAGGREESGPGVNLPYK